MGTCTSYDTLERLHVSDKLSSYILVIDFVEIYMVAEKNDQLTFLKQKKDI